MWSVQNGDPEEVGQVKVLPVQACGPGIGSPPPVSRHRQVVCFGGGRKDNMVPAAQGPDKLVLDSVIAHLIK